MLPLSQNAPLTPISTPTQEITPSEHATAEKAIKRAQAAEEARQGAVYNSGLSNSALQAPGVATPEAWALLRRATDRLNLSTRGYFKLLRVAQTIADLEGAAQIELAHLSEALQYREKISQKPLAFQRE